MSFVSPVSFTIVFSVVDVRLMRLGIFKLASVFNHTVSGGIRKTEILHYNIFSLFQLGSWVFGVFHIFKFGAVSFFHNMHTSFIFLWG